jgi:hypothetical protein
MLGPLPMESVNQPQEAAWREEALGQISWAARLGLERSLWPLLAELAPLLAGLGRPAEAKALLEKALSLAPQDQDLLRARATLQI